MRENFLVNIEYELQNSNALKECCKNYRSLIIICRKDLSAKHV